MFDRRGAEQLREKKCESESLLECGPIITRNVKAVLCESRKGKPNLQKVGHIKSFLCCCSVLKIHISYIFGSVFWKYCLIQLCSFIESHIVWKAEVQTLRIRIVFRNRHGLYHIKKCFFKTSLAKKDCGDLKNFVACVFGGYLFTNVILRYRSTEIPVSYTHLTLPTIYSV